jgi:hypothetical protein
MILRLCKNPQLRLSWRLKSDNRITFFIIIIIIITQQNLPYEPFTYNNCDFYHIALEKKYISPLFFFFFFFLEAE